MQKCLQDRFIAGHLIMPATGAALKALLQFLF
jgi:hypothetical protein